MKRFTVILLGALVFAAVCAQIEGEQSDDDEPTDAPAADADAKETVNLDSLQKNEDNNVLVLTKANFDKTLEDHPIILVEFYAPWCGHCKSLAPEYERAAAQLKANDPPVPLAKVDATVEEDLAKRFDVSGYPTLKFFKDGKPFEYDGPRKENGIVEYMKQRADPSWKPPPSRVVVLTSANFTAFVQEQELALVEFYAPWCGHCKQLAPEIEKAATQLYDNDPRIPVAIVDADAEKDLGSQFDVTGFPTLKVFRKGRVFDYTGERQSAEDLVGHMQDQVGEGSKEVKDLKALKEKFEEGDVTVGAFFDSDKDPQFQAYMDAASELRNEYTFFHTFSAPLRERYRLNAGAVVVFNAERFYTQYENKWHVSEKHDATAADVKQFIHAHKVPLVGELTRSSENSRYKDTRPLCIFFYTVDFGFEYRKATQLWRHKIAAIAKEHRDVTFAVADESRMEKKIKELQLDESAEEMNVGCYDDGQKFAMPPMEEFDSEEVAQFITQFKAGKLKPVLKSQLAPKQQGVVKTVVASTFSQIVDDASKDVLIEFYAPWCGHCKQLEPIYKKMAESLKSENNLVIAKFDATANDSPKAYKVEGFPTIFFAPAKDKANPIKFSGERTKEGMEKFLREQATVAFTSKDEL